MPSLTSKQYRLPFILITSLFFLWGVAHNLDSILIPHLKKACQLNNRSSMLVDTAVFIAYFLMPIPAGLIIRKWGYRIGIVCGLLLFALGVFLFVPAADTRAYGIFITGLFIIGSGLALLETAANPYATVLGPPESSTARLNLAQAFNGLAVMLAPAIGGDIILSGKEFTADQLTAMPDAERISYLASEAEAVKLPYIILGVVLLVVAAVFIRIKLPEIREGESGKVSLKQFTHALRNKNVVWAVVAQFFYVGAQVCVTSIFIRTAKNIGGVDEKTAAAYLGWGYGLAFMIGRFSGTALMTKISPKKLLAIYAFMSALLTIVAITATGKGVIFALIGLGFFMSIMFPTIFSLGIQGVREDTKPASSLIVMSIVGGAILPFIMGAIIDMAGDKIQMGYFVPLLCYFVILIYSLRKGTPGTSELKTGH
ncbi:MAG: L-fucose:H+ symporter permease [Chitinophagaceae bacterium]|nr:L-fucose:H+ symporter permease [Chitinophagaceae bacterium]